MSNEKVKMYNTICAKAFREYKLQYPNALDIDAAAYANRVAVGVVGTRPFVTMK